MELQTLTRLLNMNLLLIEVLEVYLKISFYTSNFMIDKNVNNMMIDAVIKIFIGKLYLCFNIFFVPIIEIFIAKYRII